MPTANQDKDIVQIYLERAIQSPWKLFPDTCGLCVFFGHDKNKNENKTGAEEN